MGLETKILIINLMVFSGLCRCSTWIFRGEHTDKDAEGIDLVKARNMELAIPIGRIWN